MFDHINRTFVLDPTHRGFAFAVLEGSERLVDWGLAQVWAKSDKEFLARVEGLLDRYRPTIVILEGFGRSRLGPVARRRIEKVAELAQARRAVTILRPTRADVRKAFSLSGSSKWEIAVAVSRWFPELESRLPRKRRPWMAEDQRMNLFDAVSMALTALRNEGL